MGAWVVKPVIGKAPKATREAINEMFAIWHARDPAPVTELVYSNPYQLLVAVVLSAQATDKGVNKATAPLFARVTTPAQMLALGEAGLTEYIKSIGLFRAKAKNVLGLSAMLVELHGGEVPRAREDLEALPGVGRKTASVVLNALWDEPTIAVDTHVFRVAHRLGLARGTTPDKVEDELVRVIPAAYRKHAHHWLILHGRYACVAQRPACGTCPVAHLCRWPGRAL